jgi:hypothetical protein
MKGAIEDSDTSKGRDGGKALGTADDFVQAVTRVLVLFISEVGTLFLS